MLDDDDDFLGDDCGDLKKKTFGPSLQKRPFISEDRRTSFPSSSSLYQQIRPSQQVTKMIQSLKIGRKFYPITPGWLCKNAIICLWQKGLRDPGYHDIIPMVPTCLGQEFGAQKGLLWNSKLWDGRFRVYPKNIWNKSICVYIYIFIYLFI